MMQKNLPDHTKLCPGCGTCLMNSARHCSVCGYVFLDVVDEPVHRPPPSNPLRVTVSVPGLVALILILLIMNTVFILGWQKRAETKVLVHSINATATFEATTFVSPTPLPTETRTPPPPTITVEPEIMYTVVSGDSCLSITARFNVTLDALARENDDLNCDLLNIGTVLTIPRPLATQEPTVTPPPPGS
jgi:LysM repeat protein